MSAPPPYTPHDPKPTFVPPGLAPGYQNSEGPLPPQTNVYLNAPIPSHNTVIVAPELFVTTLGPNSQVFTCPFCHQVSSTRIETQANSKTHMIALCMCIFVCWPCCILPYFMDSCQSRNHYCGRCNAFVGTYDD